VNKIERLDGVLEGKKVDRLPVSFWYHFGIQHSGGAKFAETVLDFYRYYDPDWLKVMNDYYYPMPDGLTEIKTKDDLKKIDIFDIEKSIWGEQLKALDIIARALDGEVYFIDTVFDPWQVLQRSLAGKDVVELAHREPDAALRALDVIAENTISYCNESFKRGIAGILLSTLGSADQMTRDDFLTFAKPPVMKIFKALKSKGIMNSVHIHDTCIYTNDVIDFPVPIINYEDRHETNPSIEEMKLKFSGCIMGGIDKTKITRRTPQEVINNVKEGIRLSGKERVLLSPGCSVPTWLYPENGKAIVNTVKKFGKIG